MRLGWRNSRPNDFQSQDLKPLRDQFNDLQKFLTIPHLSLTRTTDGPIGAGVTYTMEWGNEIEDPYDLFNPSAATDHIINVPHEFDTWWFVGSASIALTPGAAAARRAWGCHLNGVVRDYQTVWVTTAATVRINLNVQAPVKVGDTIDFRYINNSAAADDLFDAWFNGFFLPRS